MGKDVAQALGYNDAFGALKKHGDSDDKQNCQNDSFKTSRGMTIINESGLFILTGLTDPNFGLSKSHCFHGKVVYWVQFWSK